MGLSFPEQETVLRWDRSEDSMQVYTADVNLMKRLQSLPAYECIQQDRQGGQIIAMTFKAPKKLCTLRSALPKKKDFTEEELAELRERGKRLRASQLRSGTD